MGCEGGAEVGGCDEEVMGRCAGVVVGDVEDWDVGSWMGDDFMSTYIHEKCVLQFARQ